MTVGRTLGILLLLVACSSMALAGVTVTTGLAISPRLVNQNNVVFSLTLTSTAALNPGDPIIFQGLDKTIVASGSPSCFTVVNGDTDNPLPTPSAWDSSSYYLTLDAPAAGLAVGKWAISCGNLDTEIAPSTKPGPTVTIKVGNVGTVTTSDYLVAFALTSDISSTVPIGGDVVGADMGLTFAFTFNDAIGANDRLHFMFPEFNILPNAKCNGNTFELVEGDYMVAIGTATSVTTPKTVTCTGIINPPTTGVFPVALYLTTANFADVNIPRVNTQWTVFNNKFEVATATLSSPYTSAWDVTLKIGVQVDRIRPANTGVRVTGFTQDGVTLTGPAAPTCTADGSTVTAAYSSSGAGGAGLLTVQLPVPEQESYLTTIRCTGFSTPAAAYPAGAVLTAQLYDTYANAQAATANHAYVTSSIALPSLAAKVSTVSVDFTVGRTTLPDGPDVAAFLDAYTQLLGTTLATKYAISVSRIAWSGSSFIAPAAPAATRTVRANAISAPDAAPAVVATAVSTAAPDPIVLASSDNVVFSVSHKLVTPASPVAANIAAAVTELNAALDATLLSKLALALDTTVTAGTAFKTDYSALCYDGSPAPSGVAGAKTDTDCGGTGCGQCADGQACLAASDCQSNRCISNKCIAPSAKVSAASHSLTAATSVVAAAAVLAASLLTLLL